MGYDERWEWCLTDKTQGDEGWQVGGGGGVGGGGSRKS